MDDEVIYPRLTAIFRDVFDDDAIVARPDLTASEVDGWDSLSHIRLMLTVERTFKTKFSAAQIGKLKNVGELAELIRQKHQGREWAPPTQEGTR
jgi:acyl carrier protein